MAKLNGMHVAIATWRFRPTDRDSTERVRPADRLVRFLHSFAGSRVPIYRDFGIVNAWVVPNGDDAFVTVTVYSSAVGMREGLTSLPTSGEAHGGIYDQIAPEQGRTGPMTDIFHLNAHSSLQNIEHRLSQEPDAGRARRHLTIATWRIRTDVGAWPDGTNPATVPVDDLFQRFLTSARELIALEPGDHGLIGEWAVDTGEGTITYLSLYADARGMESAWREVVAEGQQGTNFHQYLELLERFSGPVLDLFTMANDSSARGGGIV
jgi:hypothetical protein